MTEERPTYYASLFTAEQLPPCARCTNAELYLVYDTEGWWGPGCPQCNALSISPDNPCSHTAMLRRMVRVPEDGRLPESGEVRRVEWGVLQGGGRWAEFGGEPTHVFCAVCEAPLYHRGEALLAQPDWRLFTKPNGAVHLVLYTDDRPLLLLSEPLTLEQQIDLLRERVDTDVFALSVASKSEWGRARVWSIMDRYIAEIRRLFGLYDQRNDSADERDRIRAHIRKVKTHG